jgi:predicted AlkP superfamily pyrophosphatase or phosphodiesterase
MLPPAPPYAGRSLARLLPDLVDGLNAEGPRRVCVLLVDGLGWELLRSHAAHAPFLTSLAVGASAEPLAVGFPTTTATSLASLGTGLSPGLHGVVGYEVAVPGSGRVMNSLSWEGAPAPRTWQPHDTAFDRAVRDGIEVTRVGPRSFDGSGLTEAALRGGAYAGAESAGERVAAAAAALRRGSRSLVYVYYGDLDATGHRSGCGSPAWALELAHVDLFARQLADALPSDAVLWITADHGMVDVPLEHRIDLADELELDDGLELVAGEPRVRYLHTRAGAGEDVLSAWRERLGASMWVLSRDEAVAAGWFGAVSDAVLPRIGDVIAAAREDVAVFDSRRDNVFVRHLVGLHGSLTDAERLVPLLMATGD